LQGICTEDIDAVSVSRRAVFAGLLAIPVASQAKAEINPFEKVRRDADALAASLAIAYGGEWSSHVGETFTLVEKVFPE
jgi:hypothetical protein